MGSLSRSDRLLGALVRRATAAAPGGRSAAGAAAAAMSPGFRIAVAVLIGVRSTRGTGMRALAAGAAAAVAARAVRDRLGRPRPGARPQAGFPSRHAAAAAAIAVTVARREPRLGRGLALAAAAGSLARVASAEHDPADVVAGALLGLFVAEAQHRALASIVHTEAIPELSHAQLQAERIHQ